MLPDIWKEAFKGWAAEKFEEACALHLDCDQFFPTVAHIKNAAADLERGRPSTVNPQRAWELSPSEQKVYALYDRLHEEAEKKRLTKGNNGDATTAENKQSEAGS